MRREDGGDRGAVGVERLGAGLQQRGERRPRRRRRGRTPARPPGQRGHQAGGQRGVDEQLQRAQRQGRVDRAEQRGDDREQRRSATTGRQPPPVAYWPTAGPRRRSRPPPPCGAAGRAAGPAAAPGRREGAHGGEDAGPQRGAGRDARRSTADGERRAAPGCDGEPDDVAPRDRRAGWCAPVPRATRVPAGPVPEARRPPRPKLVIAAPCRPAARARRPTVRRVSVPLREVLAALDARYDPALAESWDAVGLVCGDPDEPVRRVCSPSTRPPPSSTTCSRPARSCWSPTTRCCSPPVHGVPADDPKGRLVHRLIRGGAGLFVAHTNADRAAELRGQRRAGRRPGAARRRAAGAGGRRPAGRARPGRATWPRR